MVVEKFAVQLREAERLISSGSLVEAEAAAKKVLTSMQCNSADEARAGVIIAHCWSGTGRTEEAFPRARQALDAAVNASNPVLQCRALLVIARLHLDQCHHEEALQAAEQAIVLAEQVQEKWYQARAFNFIGNLHKNRGDYSKSLEAHTRAMELHQELGSQEGIAEQLDALGGIQNYKSDYVGALDYYSRALLLYEELDNQYGIAGMLSNIGSLYTDLGDFPIALDYCSRGAALFEQLGYRRAIGIAWMHIGLVYEGIGDIPRALQFHARALALFEESGYRGNVAVVLNNTGVCYRKNGEYDLATEYFERALAISREVGDLRMVAHEMLGVAEIELAQGNLNGAKTGFEEILRYQRDVLGTNEQVVQSLHGLGSTLIELGSPVEGIARIREALALAEKLGEKNSASEVHKDLSDVYLKGGDTALAFEHLRAHLALQQEINSEESKRRLEAFHVRAAVAKGEKERETEKMKREQLERELANTTLQLVAHTNRMAEIRDSMRDLVAALPPSDATVLALRSKVKELTADAIDWKKYDEQFKAAYPEFISKLIERYGALSTTEVRVCALIRMHLKSEEIARLLSLSERTVESHRNHIRKKMQLGREEDLALTLAKL